MYRGQHRRRTSAPRTSVALLLVALFAVSAFAPGIALGWGRPKECTGSAPTAVTIQQFFSAPEGTPPVTFSYQVLSGGSVVAARSLTVAPGGSASTTVGGVSPGSYTVAQEPDPGSGVAPAPPASAVIDPPACAPMVTFSNQL